MTVLITGATGLVGERLLPRLVEAGFACRVLLRAGKSCPRGAEATTGDILDPSTLPNAVRGVSSIVHLAAVFRTQDTDLIWRSNLDGTRNLIAAAKAHAPDARFIISSTSQLIGLKRLMEVVADGGGMLSVVLVGHPKLRNDLRRPTMEEIGYRSVVFEFDGMAGNQLAYIRWLLARCASEGIDIDELIETVAVELLAKRLKTPLQIEQHLTLAFEEEYRIGDRPVTAQVVESILSRQLDDLEPRLTRHGYSVRSLADQFSVKPAEIRQFLRGELSGVRAQELTQQMQAAGLPL